MRRRNKKEGMYQSELEERQKVTRGIDERKVHKSFMFILLASKTYLTTNEHRL